MVNQSIEKKRSNKQKYLIAGTTPKFSGEGGKKLKLDWLKMHLQD